MKKRIVVINQAWSNHGDEAAHKGLIRMLVHRYPNAEISVLVHGIKRKDLIDYRLYCPQEIQQVNYIWIPGGIGFNSIIKSIMLCPLFMTRYLASLKSNLRDAGRIIQGADLIVSAPGGVDIGPYRTWPNIFRLILAIHAGKPTAIYSPSIGPLPDGSWADRRFTKLAKYILQKVQFISLRDDQSQAYARELGIDYLPSSDTALLDDTECQTPSELLSSLGERYAVYVPNAVYHWHPVFKSYGKEKIEALYRKILATLLENNLCVVMLPQLFGHQNDENYFRKMVEDFPTSGITIIPDFYPCEVQQAIIRNATILVGARYHSVVFSIKNCIPFLALSYEHKISNLLTVAGLEDLMFDLQKIQDLNLETICGKIQFILQDGEKIKKRVTSGFSTLRSLAQGTAEKFGERFPL